MSDENPTQPVEGSNEEPVVEECDAPEERTSDVAGVETLGSPPVDDGLPTPDAEINGDGEMTRPDAPQGGEDTDGDVVIPSSPDLSALNAEDDQGNSGEAGVVTQEQLDSGSMTLAEAIEARQRGEFHKDQ